MIKPHEKIAVACSTGVGDGLVLLIIAYNLAKAGYCVESFSNPLQSLHSWFPDITLQPYPKEENLLLSTFSRFDWIIGTEFSQLFKSRYIQEALEKRCFYVTEKELDTKRTIVSNYAEFCQQRLGLKDACDHNGLTTPNHLKNKKYPQRVVIHPTSSKTPKNWFPKKFLAFAESIRSLGYQPVFITSPHERPDWEGIIEQGFELPLFATLDKAAEYIYESGYMVGNDSGIGHLASNLGLPTLSLFCRKSSSHFWRPGWAPGLVIFPLNLFIGCRMKQKYWQHALPVSRVVKGFRELVTL